MRDALSAGDISLSELKAAPTTIYLVLPVDMLDQHGRFLRLFVRTAIDAMAQKLPNGSLKGVPCLFLLDEFAALGRIDEIQKAAGLMPGYGVHLWPILQDYGQLTRLYRNEGAETFFGNSDVVTFFGNTDQMTLDKIARMIGEIRRSKHIFAPERQDDIGRPLMTAREIRNHVRKGKDDVVARRMIAFMPGDDILSIRPAPYFKQWDWREPELEMQPVPA
jgi:type IV secretory pathway TraG/TraD family ATPase VirD4